MINAEKTEKKTEMLMTKKAAEMTVKKKKMKKKTEKHMHADSACKIIMMTTAAYNDTETSVSITTS